MKGFSLIELIIVAAVIVAITAFIYLSLSSLRENQLLSNAAYESVAFINEARSKTLSSEDFSQYGVHIASSSLTMFKGSVFSESDPDNKTLSISPILEVYSMSLNGGGSDVVFDKLSGKTGQYGNFSLRVKSDFSKSKTITIKSTGISDVE